MAHPRMTAEIGRVLGGRYRLVAPIGMGASAQVYLADDVKLRRRVALKMLHDALAGDAEFLRRFRAEARAAAALSHPNVMAVYDWGDGEVAFIVTEYLPGGSLRALLDGGQQLSPAQALGVGLEAARALDYAHRRGFVHRDIKPANLLFGEEQRLRIADFGLARALAEAAWTEPQGAVLGTARYSSPEQAKGESLTGKADVYALALVLVEAVTGEVPFVADTTLGTLMARVGKPLVVPDSLGPLQDVLVRAGHPDPEQRIDARALATGLLRAAKQLSRPAPLPLAGALSAGAALMDDADPTVHAPLAGAAEAAPSDLTSDDLDIEPPHWVNQAGVGLAVGLAAAAATDEDDDDGQDAGGADDLDEAPDRDASDAGPVDDADGPDDAPTAAVPAGVGEGGDDAEEAVDDDTDPASSPDVDLTAVAPVAEVDLSDAAVGTPTWADTPARPPAEPDRIVVPATAGGAAPVVPDPVVVGGRAGPGGPGAAGAGPDDDELDPFDEPRRRRRWPWVALVALLVLGGGGAAAAVVANQDDAPTTPVRTILLPVPSLGGLTTQEATALAEASGWKVSVTEVRKDRTFKGRVISSSPAPGARLKAGGEVALTVSAGQVLHQVPDGLVGSTLDEAKAKLQAASLAGEVAEEVYDEDRAEGVVTSLVPNTPAELETGGTVGLLVSKGPAPRTVPSGLKGSTVEAATEALHAVQLELAKVESFSDDVAKGTIISVLPAQGSSVPRGSTVTVEVSKGPELEAVPSIAKAKDLGEAIAILEAAGFEAGDVSGRAGGKPKRTDPTAGTLVRPGATIDIVMG